MMTVAIVSIVLLLTSMVFLVVFSRLIDESVEMQAREINKQIVMNYESYINSVIETANYVQFESINLDVGRNKAAVDELYRVNTDIKKDVVSIFLFDESGHELAGQSLDPPSRDTIRKRHWFQSALSFREIYNFSAEQEKSLAEGRDELVISVSKAVEFPMNGATSSGVLLIELNNDAITDLARKTNLGERGHLLILNEGGKLLYSSEPAPQAMTATSAAVATDVTLGSRRVSIDRTDMVINVTTLLQTRWLIATVSNINAIRSARNSLMGILVIIFLVATAISALVAGFISIQISRPINQLKSAMLRIEAGDFSAPISVSGQKEIVSLAHSFESMVLKTQELMASLVSQQREKRKAELLVLQNQINPHFLYNTLDSIVWLAEHDKSRDVITMVVSLAHFFRISISKGEIFIPVEDEVCHVENYLTIQSIRYVGKFTWTVNVDESMKKLKMMKLILQPIVENAIYHGIGEEDGEITLSGAIEGDFMVFRVTNSGYGISEKKIAEMYAVMRGGRERPSVGIRNVYQRLKLYYGERADIVVTSVPDESTTVAIYIPKDIQEEV
jgi:two-component system sensor histidine kinase YesM